MKELLNIAKTSALDKDGFLHGMVKGAALSTIIIIFVAFFAAYGV